MLAFTVFTQWSPEGYGTFDKGAHEIESPNETLVNFAAAAHAAGVLEVTEGFDDSTLDSYEEAQAKLIEAMGTWHDAEEQADGTTKPGYWDGPWYEGHLAAQATTALVGQGVAESVIDIEPAEAPEDEEV